MEDGYVKETNVQEKSEEEKDLELVKSIIKSKLALDAAGKNYEYAEEDLIDYYSYQIKAEQAKLDYLLKKVKKRAISLDMINEIKLRLTEEKAI